MTINNIKVKVLKIKYKKLIWFFNLMKIKIITKMNNMLGASPFLGQFS